MFGPAAKSISPQANRTQANLPRSQRWQNGPYGYVSISRTSVRTFTLRPWVCFWETEQNWNLEPENLNLTVFCKACKAFSGGMFSPAPISLIYFTESIWNFDTVPFVLQGPECIYFFLFEAMISGNYPELSPLTHLHFTWATYMNTCYAIL